MSVSHIAGRFVKFEIGTEEYSNTYEFEVISGYVSDTANHDTYLPVGRDIMNVITHGRTVIYTFTGVLLASFLPWNEWEAGDLSNTTRRTTYGLTPGSPVIELYVTLNRGGTSTDDSFYDEVFHYSAYAQVLSMEHVFDTGNHQVFSVQLMADGSYETPQIVE